MNEYKINVNYYRKPRGKSPAIKYTHGVHKRASGVIIFYVNKDLLIWGSIYANRENKEIAHLAERLKYDIACVEYYFDLSQPSKSNLTINEDILKKIEQTQKAFIMGRIGVIMCNVVAKLFNGVNHLHHLQNFKKMSIKRHALYSASESCPDFIARRGKRYFLYEAKGSCKSSCIKQERDAIAQLNAIEEINSTYPEKYLIQTNINNKKDIVVSVVDPEGEGDSIELIQDDYSFENGYKIKFGDQEIELPGDKEIKGMEIGDYFIGYHKTEPVKDYTYQKNNYEGTIFNDGTAILRKKEVK
jgi:hypothetical protein